MRRKVDGVVVPRLQRCYLLIPSHVLLTRKVPEWSDMLSPGTGAHSVLVFTVRVVPNFTVVRFLFFYFSLFVSLFWWVKGGAKLPLLGEYLDSHTVTPYSPPSGVRPGR